MSTQKRTQIVKIIIGIGLILAIAGAAYAQVVNQ